MGNFMDKFKYFIGIDDYDDEEEEDEFYYEEELEVPIATKTRKLNNNVVNIHTNTSMKIVVHEPLSYEEAPLIADDLKSRKVVVLNFEQLIKILRDRSLILSMGPYTPWNVRFKKLIRTSLSWHLTMWRSKA